MKKAWAALLVPACLTLACAPPPPPKTTPPPATADNPADNPEGDARIVGGTPALAGSAPWQAQIYSTHIYTPREIAEDCTPGHGCFHLAARENWERIHRCGGVYIGQGLVLTAAHCISGGAAFGTTRRIRLGTLYLKAEGATFRIADWQVHPGYSGEDPPQHDIALIRIEADNPIARRFPLERAQIRILDTERGDAPLAEGDLLRITGWGRTMARASGPSQMALDGVTLNRMSPMLMQINQMRRESACANLPAYRDRLPDTTICAISDTPGVDSCNGDSGGPMTRAQGRERVLVGLVSWGRGCALPGMPALYTNVPAYRGWIETTAAALSNRPAAP
ncbi:MAG: serine protease [Polymorphobacter sp.]|uniref:serine protease n=1 Tax=Polymorphobacter sp. TaxID=1909290 RepID=UPI003A883492